MLSRHDRKFMDSSVRKSTLPALVRPLPINETIREPLAPLAARNNREYTEDNKSLSSYRNRGGAKTMLDLLIRNGTVVTPQGAGPWTIGVSGERIAYVGIDDPSLQAGRTIDAAGKLA